MNPEQIVSRACCRVDLAGATLDMWPLYLFHPGAVTVNFAVDIITGCRIVPQRGKEIRFISQDTGREDRFANRDALMKANSFKHGLAGYLCHFFFSTGAAPKNGFVLETDSESPAGAGISGSSALMIATTAALARFTGRKLGKEEMRVIAQNVEAQLIRVPTGCQDYYPALYGGVSAIELREDGVHRHALAVDPKKLEQHVALAYTGAPRQSGINNWEVFKAHIDGNKRVFRNFSEITRIAEEMRGAVEACDWSEAAWLLREEWKLRKTNAPGITTPLIDRMVASALRNGAKAAKVCGAGGGGCVVFLIEPDARERVERMLQQNGGTVLPCKVGASGVRVSRY